MDFVHENLFTSPMPTRLVVGMVDNDAFNGSYTKNPYNFKHYNLTQMKIFLDGQQQYIKPIETNYAANQYITAYMSLFSGTGKQQRDEGNDLARDDYARGYALYAFDLTQIGRASCRERV